MLLNSFEELVNIVQIDPHLPLRSSLSSPIPDQQMYSASPDGPMRGPGGPNNGFNSPDAPSSGPNGPNGPYNGFNGPNNGFNGPYGPNGPMRGPGGPNNGFSPNGPMRGPRGPNGPNGLNGPNNGFNGPNNGFNGPYGPNGPMRGPSGPNNGFNGPMGPMRGPGDNRFNRPGGFNGPGGPMRGPGGPNGPSNGHNGPSGPNGPMRGPGGPNSGFNSPNGPNNGFNGPSSGMRPSSIPPPGQFRNEPSYSANNYANDGDHVDDPDKGRSEDSTSSSSDGSSLMIDYERVMSLPAIIQHIPLRQLVAVLMELLDTSRGGWALTRQQKNMARINQEKYDDDAAEGPEYDEMDNIPMELWSRLARGLYEVEMLTLNPYLVCIESQETRRRIQDVVDAWKGKSGQTQEDSDKRQKQIDRNRQFAEAAKTFLNFLENSDEDTVGSIHSTRFTYILWNNIGSDPVFRNKILFGFLITMSAFILTNIVLSVMIMLQGIVLLPVIIVAISIVLLLSKFALMGISVMLSNYLEVIFRCLSYADQRGMAPAAESSACPTLGVESSERKGPTIAPMGGVGIGETFVEKNFLNGYRAGLLNYEKMMLINTWIARTERACKDMGTAEYAIPEMDTRSVFGQDGDEYDQIDADFNVDGGTALNVPTRQLRYTESMPQSRMNPPPGLPLGQHDNYYQNNAQPPPMYSPQDDQFNNNNINNNFNNNMGSNSNINNNFNNNMGSNSNINNNFNNNMGSNSNINNNFNSNMGSNSNINNNFNNNMGSNSNINNMSNIISGNNYASNSIPNNNNNNDNGNINSISNYANSQQPIANYTGQDQMNDAPSAFAMASNINNNVNTPVNMEASKSLLNRCNNSMTSSNFNPHGRSTGYFTQPKDTMDPQFVPYDFTLGTEYEHKTINTPPPGFDGEWVLDSKVSVLCIVIVSQNEEVMMLFQSYFSAANLFTVVFSPVDLPYLTQKFSIMSQSEQVGWHPHIILVDASTVNDDSMTVFTNARNHKLMMYFFATDPTIDMDSFPNNSIINYPPSGIDLNNIVLDIFKQIQNVCDTDLSTARTSFVASLRGAESTIGEGQMFVSVGAKPSYMIDHCIGRGTFGVVFSGHFIDTNEVIAIKQMFLRSGDEEQALIEIAREAAIMKSLDHENIVRYRQSFVDENCVSIIMDFCDGGNLVSRISKGLSAKESLSILLDIIAAVTYLHEQHILHRDLKPQNVLFKGNTVKVGDFGTAIKNSTKAKTVSHNADYDEEEGFTEMKGTYPYMAPEVVLGEVYGQACDVWSIGCIACDLFHIPLPQRTMEFKDLRNFYSTLNGVLPYEAEISKPPPAIAELLNACLCRDPRSREKVKQLPSYKVFDEFLELEKWLQDNPSPTIMDETQESQRRDLHQSVVSLISMSRRV